MTLAQALLLASVGVPALAALACVSAAVRGRMLPWLALAPLPAIAASIVAAGAPPLALGPARGLYRTTLALDAPGALLLGVAALLWTAAGAYAATYQRDDPHRGRFAASWLLALAGCLGVFVAGDVIALYLALAAMTLGATALVFHDESSPARRAAGAYVALALFGEALVLVGLVLAVAHTPGGSLAVADVAASLATSPARGATLALLVAGFGIKAGLVPMHVWMPLAHAAAPMPASAVLSGAVVKAGIIGLIRFLPVEPTLADAGTWLAIAGMLTALYAVVVGVVQDHPKVVLAYSSVSQMGFVAAVVGMGVANRDAATPILAAFYAGHHVLVKGAMFLLVGVVAATAAARLRGTMALAAFVALGLGGLPLAGGAIAKYAVKAPLGDGWAATVAAISAAGTTLLMMHFLRRVALGCAPGADARAPAGLAWPWLAMAAASIVVPWVLYASIPLGSASAAFSPGALAEAAGPVVVGIALALLLARHGARLPRVPAGDVAAAIDPAMRGAEGVAGALASLDGWTRRWTVASAAMVALAAAFYFALGPG